MLDRSIRRSRGALALGLGLVFACLGADFALAALAGADPAGWGALILAGIAGALIGTCVPLAVLHAFYLPLPRRLATRWQWMELVVERTHTVVMVTDEEGCIVEVNPAFERQTGYTLADVKGRTPSEILQGPLTNADTARRMREAAATGRSFSEEIVSYDRWGQPYFARLDVDPIRDKAGNLIGFVTTQTDTTALMEMLEDTRRARAAAEHANQVKAEFLAGMSHELRTPLNAIIGFAELMDSEILGSIQPPRYRDYLRNILTSADRLLAMITDMLDLSSLQENAFVVQLEEIELGTVITGIIEGLRPRAEAAEVQLQMRVETERTTIMADRHALARAIENVVLNAIKFTPRGGTVRVGLRTSDHGVEVEVRDTGVGISRDRLAEIQEPFNSVSGYARGPQAGTGIGLPISRRLVEVQGGHLSVESEVGRGTTVRIELPKEAAA
jgi:PAS domain S-box-containing protein